MSTDSPPFDESTPINGIETVLRRVSPRHYDHEAGVFTSEAFRPTSDDAKGISLSRLIAISAEDLLNASANEDTRNFGAILSAIVQDIFDAGMTVERDLADTPGHLIVPQINLIQYRDKRTKGEVKLRMAELQKLFEKNIVILPHRIPE